MGARRIQTPARALCNAGNHVLQSYSDNKQYRYCTRFCGYVEKWSDKLHKFKALKGRKFTIKQLKADYAYHFEQMTLF